MRRRETYSPRTADNKFRPARYAFSSAEQTARFAGWMRIGLTFRAGDLSRRPGKFWAALMIGAQTSDWLLEQSGFEPPSPTTSATSSMVSILQASLFARPSRPPRVVCHGLGGSFNQTLMSHYSGLETISASLRLCWNWCRNRKSACAAARGLDGSNPPRSSSQSGP
jgi:hypothetical protein